MNIPFLDWTSHHKLFQEMWKLDVEEILKSGVFLKGPFVQRFEKAWARYCTPNTTSHCCGVANGLDALTLSLKSLELAPDDEVLVPGNTFIATVLAVIHAGLKPVLIPPHRDDYNLDITQLDNFLTQRTKVIIPVHLYGRMCNMPKIVDWAQKNDLIVIEDAAQAHGAIYNGKKPGDYGDLTCFSFYPGKNLGALGDGGAVLSHSIEVIKKIEVLSNYGSKEKYNHTTIGFNSRLDEIQAAFLLRKLEHLDSQIKYRSEQANLYFDNLPNEIKLPARDTATIKSSWHLFVIQHPERDRIRHFLESSGVSTLIHYPKSIDQHEALKNRKLNPCLTSQELAQRILSLPIGPHLNFSDIDFISSKIRHFFK